MNVPQRVCIANLLLLTYCSFTMSLGKLPCRVVYYENFSPFACFFSALRTSKPVNDI